MGGVAYLQKKIFWNKYIPNKIFQQVWVYHGIPQNIWLRHPPAVCTARLRPIRMTAQVLRTAGAVQHGTCTCQGDPHCSCTAVVEPGPATHHVEKKYWFEIKGYIINFRSHWHQFRSSFIPMSLGGIQIMVWFGGVSFVGMIFARAGT